MTPARSRKYSAIIRFIWRKIRPSAVVKSNSGSVALAKSARCSVSSLSVVRPPTSVRAKRSSLYTTTPPVSPARMRAMMRLKIGRSMVPPETFSSGSWKMTSTPRCARPALDRAALEVRADVALAAAVADPAHADVAVDRQLEITERGQRAGPDDGHARRLDDCRTHTCARQSSSLRETVASAVPRPLRAFATSRAPVRQLPTPAAQDRRDHNSRVGGSSASSGIPRETPPDRGFSVSPPERLSSNFCARCVATSRSSAV